MARKKKHTALEPKENLNEAVSKGYETTDAEFKKLMITGAGLMGLMVAGLLFSWAVLAFFKTETARPGAPTETFVTPDEGRRPPEPRLQADPSVVWNAMRTEQDSMLTSYRWVDKDAGIVQVPIDRAMELLVEQGLPARQNEERR
jgi:hypothetical protein